MAKKRFGLGILVMVLVFGMMAVIGCDSGTGTGGTGTETNGGNGTGGGGTGGSSTVIGCRNLSAGTRCNAHSRCSNNFLCLTGQGNSTNCTTSCSC